jgi:RNA polymerase sigma factor (sigma-70 family)
MTKSEFDYWCNHHIPRLKVELIKKYPRCKALIDEDIVEFYEHILDRLEHILCPSSYLHTWVYNRHYRFHSTKTAERTGHMVYTKNFKIKLTNELPENYEEADEYNNMADQLLDLIDELPKADQILYQLYYVQELTTRQIAEIYGLTHVGIHKQIKKMQQKLKNKL